MNTLQKWLVLAVLLFAALSSYSVGFSSGAIVFVALGVILELAFWFGVFSKNSFSEESRQKL